MIIFSTLCAFVLMCIILFYIQYMWVGKGKAKGSCKIGVGSTPTCYAPVLHKSRSMKFLVSCRGQIKKISSILHLLYAVDSALSSTWHVAGNVICHAGRKCIWNVMYISYLWPAKGNDTIGPVMALVNLSSCSYKIKCTLNYSQFLINTANEMKSKIFWKFDNCTLLHA